MVWVEKQAGGAEKQDAEGLEQAGGVKKQASGAKK
jgi:hypothetical protein